MQERELPNLKEADIRSGDRVLLRVDFNVPVESGSVRDGFRIDRSVQTINYLQQKGAKIILISHITSTESLLPVSKYLETLVPHTFISDPKSHSGQDKLNTMKAGEIVLLENLRLTIEEENNDLEFAKSLASLADIYINDAFSVSHRRHASIVGVPQFLPSYMGFLLEEEVVMLGKALQPEKPLLFILGGAKFETKIPLVEKFFDIADQILLGGALVNDVYRTMGFEVGRSLVSNVDVSHLLKEEKIIIPEYVVVERSGEKVTVGVNDVRSEEAIYDIAPISIANDLVGAVSQAKTILWNGPLGNYEAGFTEGSAELAKLIAEAAAFSIVGGGDTVALLEELGIADKFGFISTGGGAMLDFLSSGTLPGLQVLDKYIK